MPRPTRPSPEGEIIIEFRRVGASVKVSAIEPKTLIEVSIIGPASSSRGDLERAVLRKLEYVMAKKGRR